MTGIIKSRVQTRTAMEGNELVREYFKPDRLCFGTSELLPGTTGELDPGHSEADEVFFCARGHVLVYFPEEDHYYELMQGDALLIPQGAGHKLYNAWEETALVVWCCAPHP